MEGEGSEQYGFLPTMPVIQFTNVKNSSKKCARNKQFAMELPSPIYTQNLHTDISASCLNVSNS